MGQANPSANTPFEESNPNTPTTSKRLKTRRPVKIPSDASARLTEFPSIQHEKLTETTATRSSTRLQMKRRSPKKAYCCYPIHFGTTRQISTPTKTVIRATVAAPVKCITNANAVYSARKRHSGGSSASRRSLKFGIKTLPSAPQHLEKFNELSEWHDIEEISCEQTADELENMFYALQHTDENNDLPDLSFLNNCLEAELHQAEHI